MASRVKLTVSVQERLATVPLQFEDVCESCSQSVRESGHRLKRLWCPWRRDFGSFRRERVAMSVDPSQSGRDHRLAKVLVVPLCGIDSRRFGRLFDLLQTSYTPLTGVTFRNAHSLSTVASTQTNPGPSPHR